MFADPLTLTAMNLTAAAEVAGGAAIVFTATGRGPLSSTYRYSISSSHYIDLLISRQVGKRTRSTVRLTEVELVADPMDNTKNSVKTSTVYIVDDRGPLGDGTNQTVMTGLLGWFLSKPSDAASPMSRVRNGET